MSPWRFFSLIVAAALALPASAAAQSRVGEQWLTAGLAVTPGFFWDSTAPEVGLSRSATVGGLHARLGFQHRAGRRLVMAAEAELGQGWHNASRVAPDGRADSDHHFEWQLGLVGRLLGRDDGTGPTAGLGLHMFRAAYEEAPLQALSGDLRLGWYFWRKDNFVLGELGYAVPFLAGLDLPTQFTEEGPEHQPQSWTLHRFVVGFSYGFRPIRYLMAEAGYETLFGAAR